MISLLLLTYQCLNISLLKIYLFEIRIFDRNCIEYLYFIETVHVSILSKSTVIFGKELDYQDNGRKNIYLHALVYLIRFKIRVFLYNKSKVKYNLFCIPCDTIYAKQTYT